MFERFRRRNGNGLKDMTEKDRLDLRFKVGKMTLKASHEVELSELKERHTKEWDELKDNYRAQIAQIDEDPFQTFIERSAHSDVVWLDPRRNVIDFPRKED